MADMFTVAALADWRVSDVNERPRICELAHVSQVRSGLPSHPVRKPGEHMNAKRK